MSQLLRFGLRLLIGCLLLLAVLQFVDVGEAAAALRNLELKWVLAAIACWLSTRVLIAIKWWMLLGARRSSVSYATVQRALCLSDYYGLLFPNSLFVDATRALLLRHHKRGLSYLTATILADRLVNISVMTFMSIGALCVYLLTQTEPVLTPAVVRIVAVTGFLFLAACVLVMSRRFVSLVGRTAELATDKVPGARRVQAPVKKIQAAYESILRLFANHRTFLPILSLSALFILARVGMIFFLFCAVGAPQTFLLTLMLVPIINLTALLPLTVMGIGLKGGAFVVLFGGAGVPTSIALAVSLATYPVVIGLSLLLGLLASFIGPDLPKADTVARNQQGTEPG